MALHEIVYVSLATHAMHQDELLELLDQAREYNQRHGITGLLLYHREEFLQLIEGERKAVEALYATICRDLRHQQVFTLWEGPLAQRSFERWSMGFVAPDDADLRERSGYTDLLNQGVLELGHGHTGKRLLMRLREDFLAEA